MSKSKKANKLSPEQQQQRRIQMYFKQKIRKIFNGMGFTYVATHDNEMTIGLRAVEVDALFIYENVWLLCEDTIKTAEIRDHIRTKNEAFGEIRQHLSDFVEKLIKLFPDKADILQKYETDRIQLFGLYISREELDLTENDRKLFSNLTFVQPQTLNYFAWMVQCIKLSARNELFRFLNLSDGQIGFVRSSSSSAEITAPIIYPKQFTGLKNKVRIVSFMMSAEDLLNMGYVLRKDNWDGSIWPYQRLIDKKKIKKIRAFMESKGEAFYNNIIVALPDNISFRDASKKIKSIDEMSALETNCELILPRKMNSICVIDGQHRIYAHYESGINSKQEQHIATLRKELHLLVTGLVFPSEMSVAERARIQSAIFLDINKNATPVPPNVLMHIKRIGDPIDDESLAQFVIEKLNREGIFKAMFQLSPLDTGKIKTASIVRFALRYLVTIEPADGKCSLYQYWDGDKEALERIESSAIDSYVQFCAMTLRNYFGAIRKNMNGAWNDKESKLLSTISINGFIIALTRQLKVNGVQDFNFYDKVFHDWQFDFSAHGFPYTSSQYHKFASQILIEAFQLDETKA